MARVASSSSHSTSIQLILECFISVIAQPEKQYAGSGRTAPGVLIFRSVIRTTKSARTPHANPITPRCVSVNASASRALARAHETVVGAAEEVQPASVHATG